MVVHSLVGQLSSLSEALVNPFFRNGLDMSAQNVSCSRNEDDVKQSQGEKTQHALRPFLWSNISDTKRTSFSEQLLWALKV